MDIKEIALKHAREYLTFKLGGRKGLDVEEIVCDDEIYKEIVNELAQQFEALIAELAKQNEPCVFLHEWIEYHPFGDTYAGKRCATITNDEKPFDSSDTVSPIFTFPPTVEQIAKAEQRVAEACALQVATETKFHWLDAARVAKEIRSGEWRKFVKEV